jgi:hypothetical protein
MVYDITFKRLTSESSMETVLQRPWTEEAEDYAKYKRLKSSARDKRQEAERKAMKTKPGDLVFSGSDGTTDARYTWPPKQDSIWDVYEDQFAESPKGSVVVRSTNRNVVGKEAGREFS